MTSSQGLEVFSGDGGVDHWQTLVDETYGATTNYMLGDQVFHGELRTRELGQLLATRIASTPMKYQRAHSSSATDNYFIALTLCAEAHVVQRGRHSVQRRGDIVLYDAAQAYSCAFPGGDDQIVFAVPRQQLLRHLGRADQLLSQTLPRTAALGALAGGMMQQVLDLESLAHPAAVRLGDSLLEVIANAFELAFVQPEAPPAHHLVQLSRAQRHVRENLADTSLSLESVARAAHVSPRTLSRLFAHQGTTFSRWLWQLRLEQCHQSLARRQYPSVTEAALNAGFTNAAHLSRVFRQTYGIAPSQLLNPSSRTV